MLNLRFIVVVFLFALPGFSEQVCPRPEAGSQVTSPPELHSSLGKLELTLAFRSAQGPEGHMRYCYIADDGAETPTLRVHPGDQVVLKLKNELIPGAHAMAMPSTDCAGGMMGASSTNLHFHGLSVPPVCHQDETVKTLIPAASTFEYHFQIPKDEPPGLYWYHPHPHGFSEQQVLGGASGALIVEGIDQVNHATKGLPERVLVLRDQWVRDSRIDLKKPDPNKPGKDLSVNFVPVLYPEYLPAVIRMKPGERQFWRVLNASADTYIDLKIQSAKPQFLGVIALDGVPFGYADGSPADHIVWQSHILLPPAGRAEFLFNGPASGEAASLITQAVETGPTYDADSPPPVNGITAADDDNSPTRTLANIVTAADAAEPNTEETSLPLTKPTETPLAQAKPTRERKLFFSETTPDAQHPAVFYITEDGKTPVPYDPNAGPNITVRQGDVEDWTIENRSQETHAFHIHQTHFVVLERHSVPVDEPHLRDTINVPYWDGFTPLFPSIKIRLDFRDPNIVGTFPYHCHILQHEDGGMMGTIRVEPKIR